VPVARRAREVRSWPSWLAASFAVLLAIAPLARPPLPVDLTPAPARSGAALAVRGDAGAPASRVRPAEPIDLGVLARWSWLETKPALSPAPPAAGRPRVAGRALAAASAIRAHAGNPRGVFHLSSVGTARRPTGPPAPVSASA
jgi:hypothetical protein